MPHIPQLSHLCEAKAEQIHMDTAEYNTIICTSHLNSSTSGLFANNMSKHVAFSTELQHLFFSQLHGSESEMKILDMIREYCHTVLRVKKADCLCMTKPAAP